MSVFVITLTVLLLLFCLVSCGAGCRVSGSRYAAPLFCAAWCVAAALFVANALLAQGLPFGNMRHVLCFFPLVMVPCAFVLRRMKCDLIPYFAGASALACIGALCMPLQAEWRQMPALQSPWFAPHVTSYVVAYGMLAVSALLAAAAWGVGAEKRLRAADKVVKLAFPFLTFGLWSGALWRMPRGAATGLGISRKLGPCSLGASTLSISMWRDTGALRGGGARSCSRPLSRC